jgi:hypothetical protein
VSVPTPARYPLPTPPDDRFSDSFVEAVADLLAEYHFPAFDNDSPDFGRLYRYLRGFLYGGDPEGFGFTRETVAEVGPVPEHVEGHSPSGREPQAHGRLCAHADQDGAGAHWLAPGERCPLAGIARRAAR